MSNIAPEQLDRISAINANCITSLADIALAGADDDSDRRIRREVYDNLPKAMDEQEVANLGACVVESVAQRPVYSRTEWNRNKVKVSAVRWLANMASANYDEKTFDSARTHLKTLRLRGKKEAFYLWLDKHSSLRP